MRFLSLIYQTILDALFPLSAAERELFSYSPQEAAEKLPRAPKYSEPITDCYSIFAYKDERVAKLVWNVKYKKSEQAVRIGGYALWKALSNKAERLKTTGVTETEGRFGPSVGEGEPAADSAESDGVSRSSVTPVVFTILPIPITARRRKERGYNQCELLVDEIARLDTEKKFVINKNVLIRTQHVSRQTLKGREERLESAKGIFEVIPHEMDKKIPVVIIDDVITTGSTTKEAMQTMKNAGFETVYGLSVAH